MFSVPSPGRWLPVCLLLLLRLPCSAGPRPASSPWNALVVGRQTTSERLATVDLQRYLAQITGRIPARLTPEQWRRRPVPAVVLGTPATNRLLAGLSLPEKQVGSQGCLLANRQSRAVNLILAAGRTPEGAANAVYCLLREVGYRFYLGSEAAPVALPARLPVGTLYRRPAFAMRGVLPWYNFFDSPTAWDPIDHRAFIDQLARMGANFLGFHTYDSEPFAAVPVKGRMQHGARLLSTATPTWGTSALPTHRFAGGTGRLYADDFFGAATTRIPGADRAIRREQAVMRDALNYARARGLHTCLGFEMSGDPTDPAVRAVFLARLNHLLDTYPALDYVWIWQSETIGASGFRAGPSDSPLARYGAARRRDFTRAVDRTAGERPFFEDSEAGRRARALEGARLEQFAQLALRTLGHRACEPRLVISGWGGDERLLSAEYYAGLDRLLPRSVVFASLDHIAPRERVDRVYAALSPQRERWPIPWLENDGDQWHPQPFVHTYERLAADARAAGCQGLLGIHWRTRDVEENFAYLMQFAWHPGLTAEAFFRDYARRGYDARIAGRMARIHSALDRLGYRWIGGSGQAECGNFAWATGNPAQTRSLEALRAEAAGLLPRAGRSAPRLRWLLNGMDWVLAFQQVQQAAMQAQRLLAESRTAPADRARGLAREALERLDDGMLARALQTYARRVTTRGEYGVLATINTKAVVAWRDLRREARQSLGLPDAPEPSDDWKPAPGILMPRHLTSSEAGKPLTLEPVVLGGRPAWGRYRRPGSAAWTVRRLTPVRGWVQRMTIPADVVAAPGLEVAFALSPSPAVPPAWGPVTVTAMPPAPELQPSPLRPPGASPSLAAAVRADDPTPLEVTWTDLPGADYFKVFRDGVCVAETAVPCFPDAPARREGRYRVEAWRDGQLLARSQPIAYTTPDRPITAKVAVTCRANRTAVLLHWDPAEDLAVTAYRVYRAPVGTDRLKLLATLPASFTSSLIYRDRPPAGRWAYEVRPAGVTGSEGAGSRAEIAFPPAVSPSPVVSLPLTARPDGAEQVGAVTYGAEGAAFAGGYLLLPHHDGLNMERGLTVRFEFRADSVEEMPVLLSHGAWQIDGWFAQILGGRLLIRTPSGDAVGPVIEPGKWYAVRWVFDGMEQRLAINGQWLPQAQTLLRPAPCSRTLVIGQYEQKDRSFAFRGILRNLTIEEDVAED